MPVILGPLAFFQLPHIELKASLFHTVRRLQQSLPLLEMHGVLTTSHFPWLFPSREDQYCVLQK